MVAGETTFSVDSETRKYLEIFIFKIPRLKLELEDNELVSNFEVEMRLRRISDIQTRRVLCDLESW